jgi:hypothetical protein
MGVQAPCSPFSLGGGQTSGGRADTPIPRPLPRKGEGGAAGANLYFRFRSAMRGGFAALVGVRATFMVMASRV